MMIYCNRLRFKVPRLLYSMPANSKLCVRLDWMSSKRIMTPCYPWSRVRRHLGKKLRRVLQYLTQSFNKSQQHTDGPVKFERLITFGFSWSLGSNLYPDGPALRIKILHGVLLDYISVPCPSSGTKVSWLVLCWCGFTVRCCLLGLLIRMYTRLGLLCSRTCPLIAGVCISFACIAC